MPEPSCRGFSAGAADSYLYPSLGGWFSLMAAQEERAAAVCICRWCRANAARRHRGEWEVLKGAHDSVCCPPPDRLACVTVWPAHQASFPDVFPVGVCWAAEFAMTACAGGCLDLECNQGRGGGQLPGCCVRQRQHHQHKARAGHCVWRADGSQGRALRSGQLRAFNALSGGS